MYSHITGKSIPLPLMPLLLGSCLMLAADITPAKAEISHSNLPDERVLLAQSVYETLPPPPTIPNQEVEFNSQPNQTYQAQYDYQYQYQPNYQSYFVYVDNNSRLTLQRVRSLEPGAYIQQFNGRSVIRAGTFRSESNAWRRARELESYGIYGARVARVGGGQNVPDNPDTGYYDNNRSRYYVSIPAKSEEMPGVADRVRSAIGRNASVNQRIRPLGPHVAVGPFTQRLEAEKWNNYLRSRGFSNARVYYGK